jgi:hypothetical protein
MSAKKQHTIRVDVATGNGIVTIYVRHESARQAKAWVADNFISAERATDDDLIRIGRDHLSVHRPLDPPVDLGDDVQLDAFQPSADPEKATREIDDENRRNAAFANE